MTALRVEEIGLDTVDTIGLSDLALACAMSCVDLQELMEFGALRPLATNGTEPLFAVECMDPLRTAGKLRSDYDLDLFVVVLVLNYLERIEQLESQLRAMQVSSLRAPRFSTSV